MKLKIVGIFVCMLLIATVIPACGTINVEINVLPMVNDGTLSGFVKDSSMNPIEGALVQVDFHDSTEEDYTDSSGYYHVTNIPICYCMKNCTASKPGYKREWISLAIVEDTTHDFMLSKSNILFVGGSGPGNYSTIQEAINDANNGDTVFVYDDSSPYYENIIIEKSITLTGENRETTLILGDESSDWVIVNISADDVSISGFTIQPNAGQPAGIVVAKNYTHPDYWNIVILKNVYIYNNIIRNTGKGIFGIRLKYGDIHGNIIENCKGSGIHLFIPLNTTISNNIVSDCSYRGVEIDGLWGPYRLMNYRNPVPKNNIITQNTILSNRWGIQLNGGPVNTKISNNNITENHEIGIQIYNAYKTEITRNNFIKNNKNAYFTAVMVIRYPRFMKNTWDNNYWGEPNNIFVRIDGTLWFMPIPRLPIGISFPNFSLTEFELSWMAFDWNPAQEPYDI